ncbi:MAG: glycosyltransferase [Pedobacter sp.]|jgi:glycosyltransferase involved in cell wall biosynthesis|uniref:glycosyltransferase family 1 protein n=1 Tax=Pedobacter sp. TaxID=1411316 RepID=UPI0035687D8D
MNLKLNIFYEEPNNDRWVKYDRYPRQIIRRIIRGKSRPGGVMLVALELMRGLDLLKIPYRFNDYQYAKQHPNELIGVIGKPHLIFEKRFKNPILFGAGIFSHPIECPNLFEVYPNIKKILVPGDWMRLMCEPYYPNKVIAWPVGIDTEKWSPKIKAEKLNVDFLIYDKIRWDHDKYDHELLQPIIKELKKQNLSYHIIRYGNYNHADLINELNISKAVIFLCEHETQGIAYQQILSTNTPILAWDRGGYWQDPFYFPEKVKYEPVTSVPYWDERCGLKFKDWSDFAKTLEKFISKLKNEKFEPRAYILENLTLEISAQKYVDIYKSLTK